MRLPALPHLSALMGPDVNGSAAPGRVAETFFSIQGEGATAGAPAVFIRLQGCSVGCAWCDTKYSWNPGGGHAVDLEVIVTEAVAYPCRRAVVTGGEPLESSLFLPLTRALAERAFTLEVENLFRYVEIDLLSANPAGVQHRSDRARRSRLRSPRRWPRSGCS